MDNRFGAVLTQVSEGEKDLISAWLQVNGLVVKECTNKTWKDFPDSVRLFSKPTPELAKELLDWSIEPILCGHFSKEEKDRYKSIGVSCLWEKPYNKIHTLPTNPLPKQNLTWVVYTKNPILDKHLLMFLKTMGYQVYIEGTAEFLLQRMQTSNCHFLILDWDAIDAKAILPPLQKIKREKPFLSIGQKDFNKEHLYRDLKMGIGGISEVLIDGNDFWRIFLNSFPLTEESSEEKHWKESSQSIAKLTFSFQEKRIPVTMKLGETTKFFTNPQNQSMFDWIDLFRWLE